jgi:hypothetical protein
MVELVVFALYKFDSKQPCVGKAWLVMKNVEKHVKSLWNPPFLLQIDYIARALNAIYTRWDMLASDLYYARGLLNPFLLDEGEMDDPKVKHSILKVLQKLIVGGHVYASTLSEYQAFQDCRGVFSGLPNFETLNLDPHE